MSDGYLFFCVCFLKCFSGSLSEMAVLGVC